MVRWLTRALGAAVNRRLRGLLLGVVAAAAVGLFGAVSLGFGTFAAYVYLRASEGQVAAALIVGAAYGLLAVAIWVIGMARRHAGPWRRAAAVTVPAPSGPLDSLLGSLSATGNPQDQVALDAAMKLGRELSPMQLVALALIGGFIAGSKLGR